MLQEEKMEKEEGNKLTPDATIIVENNVKPTASTTYPPTNQIRPLGALPLGMQAAATNGANNPLGGGMSVLSKLRAQNKEDDILNKIKPAQNPTNLNSALRKLGQ